jgi:iron complex outermembrane receptor protein
MSHYFGRRVSRRSQAFRAILTALGFAAAAAMAGWGVASSVCAAETTDPAGVDTTTDQILFQEIPTVVGASKYEQRTTEAPSYISIVTAEEIKRYGYRTLADIVASVAGFYPDYDRSYHYVGLRGFSLPGDYNTRVLVLLNGHRLNENIYDSAGFGTDGIIDVELIERVEIIRGPGSSLYGSNALCAMTELLSERSRTW